MGKFLALVLISLSASYSYASIEDLCFAKIFAIGNELSSANYLCKSTSSHNKIKNEVQLSCLEKHYRKGELSYYESDYNQAVLAYCYHVSQEEYSSESLCFARIFEKGQKYANAKHLCTKSNSHQSIRHKEEVACLVERYNPGELSYYESDFNQTQLSYCRSAYDSGLLKVTAQQQKSIAEINKELRPPRDTQVILNNVRIKGNKSCATVQESKTVTQCYVCHSEEVPEGVLYSNERILLVTHIILQESRKEITLHLTNDRDLNMIRCFSDNDIKIGTFEEVEPMLKASGIKLIDPGFIERPAPKK